MAIRFINAFLEGTIKVLKMMAFLELKSDSLVKSRNLVFFVIPVKTGIQYLQYVT